MWSCIRKANRTLISILAVAMWAQIACASSSANAKPITAVSIHENEITWIEKGRLLRASAALVEGSTQFWRGTASPLRLGTAVDLLADAPIRSAKAFCETPEGTIYFLAAEVPGVFSITRARGFEKIHVGAPLKRPSDLACDGQSVFITEGSNGGIYSTRLPHGALVEEYLPESGISPTQLAASPGALFAFDPRSKAILRFLRADPSAAVQQKLESRGAPSLSRGEVIHLPKSMERLSQFAVNEQLLYVNDEANNSLVIVPLLGGDITKITKTPWTDALGTSPVLATDDERLYFYDVAAHQFLYIPLLSPATVHLEAGTPSESLAQLYEYLLSRQLLPTREYVLKENDAIANVVVKENVLPNGYVARIDQTLCRLNRSLCTKSSIDTYHAGDILVLPDLDVSMYLTRLPVSLPIADLSGDPRLARHPNGPLRELALEFLGDQRYRTDVDNLLISFNKSSDPAQLPNASKGRFYLPVESIRVKAIFPQADLSNQRSSLNRILSRQVSVYSAPKAMAKSIAAPRAMSEAGEQQPDGLPYDPPSGCERIDPRLSRSEFRLISYCRPSNTGSTEIGVVDQHFDDTHPVFQDDQGQSRLTVYTKENPNEFHREVFGRSEEPIFDLVWDHGTHVSGLLAGSWRTNQMLGIHPSARVYGIRVGDLKDAVDDNQMDLAAYLISLGEKQSNLATHDSTEQLRRLVASTPWVVFVISAGNEGIRVVTESLASTGTLSHVIVVGATTDESPAVRLPESNWDPDAVSIMAPGKELKSALFRSTYAPASGTSQSAALVAGAVAVLRAWEPNWEPWKIKQRMVSTADLWPELQGREVLGGMLNVYRAVTNRTSSVIHWTNGSQDCIGRIPSRFRNRELQIRNPGRPTIRIMFKNLRRMHRESDQSSFTVLYSEPSDNTLKRVSNIPGARISDAQFDFVPEGSCNLRQVDLLQVDDFINGFYQ